ncbi:DDE-type integrase/transposase/recombinase [Vagococcus acidifermentans]|uniref:Transposase n=1 Tax=Vagococcus acidifermentans TaxID=564710 RepID=A0A430ATL1_9ENTE|nr:DDE-type integrase/transposase/recombinase [Vagococcus acidifermentans]RSU11393.1 transposase [Vagococcus acidifermentans]
MIDTVLSGAYFGTMEVVHEGSFKEVKTLVMTFPFSNAGFAVVLPAENQECLLEGMKELFKQAGGVPTKIRIDNMSTAVVTRKSRTAPAVLTDGFLQFATHYGFETQVCNPRSGHEKGSVENKVGYVRYHFFAGSPIMKDFTSFNHELAIQLVKDQERRHYEKGVPIKELWQEEKNDLLNLPEMSYPVFKEIEVKANKYNEISLDGARLHIPRCRNHSLLFCLLKSETYQLFNGQGEVIDEGPRPYMHKKRDIDWMTIFMDWRRKLRSMPYSRYWKYLPSRIQLFLSHPDWQTQAHRVEQLINFLTTQDMLSIEENLYELLSESKDPDIYEVTWQSYDQFLQPFSEKKVVEG